MAKVKNLHTGVMCCPLCFRPGCPETGERECLLIAWAMYRLVFEDLRALRQIGREAPKDDMGDVVRAMVSKAASDEIQKAIEVMEAFEETDDVGNLLTKANTLCAEENRKKRAVQLPVTPSMN